MVTVAVRVGQALQPFQIAQIQAAVRDAEQAAPLRFAQSLVGVNQRQPQAVGDVLLRQRKRHALRAAVRLQGGRAFEQQHPQRRDPFFGATPPNRQPGVIHQRLFVRRQPGDVETHRRLPALRLP